MWRGQVDLDISSPSGCVENDGFIIFLSSLVQFIRSIDPILVLYAQGSNNFNMFKDGDIRVVRECEVNCQRLQSRYISVWVKRSYISLKSYISAPVSLVKYDIMSNLIRHCGPVPRSCHQCLSIDSPEPMLMIEPQPGSILSPFLCAMYQLGRVTGMHQQVLNITPCQSGTVTRHEEQH